MRFSVIVLVRWVLDVEDHFWEIWDILETENFKFRIIDSKHHLEMPSGLVIQMQINDEYNLNP